MMTLRQLRYLAAIARHGHFGRAAAACAVTQPALSMQVRDLERTLGVTLVERMPGDARLTDLGRNIARRGDDILAAAHDLMDFAQQQSGPLTGRLVLGIIPSLAPYVLPRLLPVLRRAFPALKLELRETQTRALLDEVRSRALDAAMVALPVAETDLDIAPLFDDPFLLAVPADDPRDADTPIGVGDIDQPRLILLEDGHCLREQALAFCATARASDSGLLTLGASSLTTVMEMVAGGYGVTLMPRIAMDVERRNTRVKFLAFQDPAPGRKIGLAYRRTSPRKDDFAALGAVVSEALDLKPFPARTQSTAARAAAAPPSPKSPRPQRS